MTTPSDAAMISDAEIEALAKEYRMANPIHDQQRFDTCETDFTAGFKAALSRAPVWPSEDDVSQMQDRDSENMSSEWWGGFNHCYHWLRERMKGQP